MGERAAPRVPRAGVTSENVAERYGITRAQQDEMAARSHRRAAAAQASGRFADEIVPVKTLWKDPKTVRAVRHGDASLPLPLSLPAAPRCVLRVPALLHLIRASVSRPPWTGGSPWQSCGAELRFHCNDEGCCLVRPCSTMLASRHSRSHRTLVMRVTRSRASAPIENCGVFSRGSSPVLTFRHAIQGEEKEIVVDKDDGVRPGVTPQALGSLKAVFKKNGTTTAGNSSQVRFLRCFFDVCATVAWLCQVLATRSCCTAAGALPLDNAFSSSATPLWSPWSVRP